MNVKQIIDNANSYFNDEMYFESLIEYGELYVIDKSVESIDTEKFTFFEIESIKEKVTKDYERALRIMSIGNQWNEDEFLLLLTIRINLEIVRTMFDLMGIEFGWNMRLFDEDLQDISKSKMNDNDYTLAKNLLLRNNKLPHDFLLAFIP